MLALFAFLGALAAVAYTFLLVQNARLWGSSNATSSALILHVARTAGVIAVLVGFALAGPGALVAALVGFVCAHTVSLAVVRRLA